MPARVGQTFARTTLRCQCIRCIRSRWEPSACAEATRRSRGRACWPLHPGWPRSVNVRSAVSFLLGMTFLLGDARLFRRSRRLGWSPRLCNRQSVLHEAHQALVGRLLVLRLASSVTRNNPHHSVRVESRCELRAETLTLLVRDCHLSRQIPKQLDASRRRVDVLPTCAAGSSRLVLKLRSRDRNARAHSEERIPIHSRLRLAEAEIRSSANWPACNRAQPGSSNTRYSRLQRFSRPDSLAVCNSSRDSCVSPPVRPTQH